MAKVKFTAPVVSGFKCPLGKAQAFIWDAAQSGLGLRVTPAGAPAFVFQAPYLGRDVRVTIGGVSAWSIPQAQAKARELQREIDAGRDPRGLKRSEEAAAKGQRTRAARELVTVQAAWDAYIADRSAVWKPRTLADHCKMTITEGTPHARLPGRLREAGPLAELMPVRLCVLTPDHVNEWAAREAKQRPARVRLALRMLKAFLRWAAAEPAYRGLADAEAASGRRAREAAGSPRVKSDCLQREQLGVWFAHVRTIPNPVISAYLQVLLLTGARREELAGLKWEAVDRRWKVLHLAEKVGHDPRPVPLTPYVDGLISRLPRINAFVFPAVRTLDVGETNSRRRARYHAAKGRLAVVQRSASGHISDPSIAHRRACESAGLAGLTLHGLRRSFISLSEWLDIPAGVVAQIVGHRPTATAEKYYIRRPVDLLRVHHERIERWVLEQADKELNENKFVDIVQAHP